MLLPNTAQQAAAELAENPAAPWPSAPVRMRAVITATVSIGVCGGLHGNRDWERLLRCRPRRWHAAKAAGRNRVVSGRFARPRSRYDNSRDLTRPQGVLDWRILPALCIARGQP